MHNLSGYGLTAVVQADVTFPSGFTLTQFADDGDSLDIPSIKVAETAMGMNGDLITWSKAAPLLLTVNLVPNSEDDKNMEVLLEANRVGKGKLSARDVITLTVIFPDGDSTTYYNGVLTDGMPGRPIQGSCRMKSKAYTFAFENRA